VLEREGMKELVRLENPGLNVVGERRP